MRKSDGKKAKLIDYLERTKPGRIGFAEWEQISAELSPVSPGYLRRLLRDTGIPLHPLVEGVRQDNVEDLTRTLLQLESEYSGGDLRTKQACRDLVIAAKDHARFALRRLPAADPKRAAKEEMLLWILTWLENPGAFPVWLELRRRHRPPPPASIPVPT